MAWIGTKTLCERLNISKNTALEIMRAHGMKIGKAPNSPFKISETKLEELAKKGKLMG